MQPIKNKNSVTQARIRKNAFAKHLITFFGWSVLIIFLALIIHIFINSLPLLKTPKLIYQTSFIPPDFDSELGQVINESKLAVVGIHDCAIQINEYLLQQVSSEVNSKHLTRFPCKQKHISIATDSSQSLQYATIDAEGLFELFQIDLERTGATHTRITSFFAPPELTTGLVDNIDEWQAKLVKNILYIWRTSEEAETRVIAKNLKSLDAPIKLQSKNLQQFFPLRFNQQKLFLKSDELTIQKDNQAIQTINLKQGSAVLALPSGQGFMVFDNEGYKIFGVLNVNGIFEFKELTRIYGKYIGQPIAIDFHRATGALILLTEVSEVVLLNPNTFEIVAIETLDYAANGIQVVDDDLFIKTDQIRHFRLENMVGITTWNSLFSKINYVGYQAPEYIWQSSQVTPNAQAKYSVVPLIVGSIKAALLSLLVAVPLACGASVFTAYFASDQIRSWLKPCIEMLEAVPSVIIGFVAAVWLAPITENYLLAIVISLLLFPFLMMLGVFLHNRFSYLIIKFYTRRAYFFLAVLIFMLVSFVIFYLSSEFQLLLQNNQDWFTNLIESVSLSKSALLVAIALGIAITPTIYSLIDDAINEVPKVAILASFALGATKGQTLIHIVLVVASPSIIAAVMLGFGRAFGETMIVLMIAGNTPTTGWDLLDGLRTLTSNLTIELQESATGSTHFHILFLTAAVLFLFTFCINTLATAVGKKMIRNTAGV